MTNTQDALRDELEDILLGDKYPSTFDEIDAIVQLIADRERQARIDEVERFAEVPFVKVQKYYIDRIAALTNQKPNKETTE